MSHTNLPEDSDPGGVHDAQTLSRLRVDDALAPLNAGGLAQAQIRDVVRSRLFAGGTVQRRIGRFVVLGQIGQGGMGTVLSAYDEQLDRKVAIKLLRMGESPMARMRLKREAQAMARLSHPNVVTVHEVGEVDGEIYVAMEFIRGQTLDVWSKTKPDWREVLGVFDQAGQGLLAAHEAGIIHRDLKPHNIMRADDGTVKVLDFGLARTDSPDNPDNPEGTTERNEHQRCGVHPDDPEQAHLQPAAEALAVELTQTGTVLGTPAYMSPEQYKGLRADARSDQYSFCTALYCALYGQLPFAAPTLAALVYNIDQGKIQPPPQGSTVPTWVFRVIARGLHVCPDERWPSIQTLLERLRHDPAQRRRRRLAGASAVLLAGIMGFGLANYLSAQPRACVEMQAHREDLWSSERRNRVAAAFEATHSHLAHDTLARVEASIDNYANAWAHLRTETCETHRDGRQSTRLFHRRLACLDTRRAGFEQLLTSFEQADAATVENAVWATASLPSVTACGDVGALTAAVAPPADPQLGEQVQVEREHLASAASLMLAGSHDAAITKAQGVRDRAVSLGYPPLLAEAELRLGGALMGAHRYELARMAFTSAIEHGVRAAHDEAAAEALARRMWVIADPLRHPAEGMWDASMAEALVDKIGRPTRLYWLVLNNRGAALFRSGQFQAAERSYREALDVLDAEPGQTHAVEHIKTRSNLAMLMASGLGRPQAAAEELRAVRVEMIELLGQDHPRVSMYADPIAENLTQAGRHHEALAEIDEWLGRLDASQVYLRVLLLLKQAQIYSLRHSHHQALDNATQALALARKDLAEDYLVSVALWSRGAARVGLGQTALGLEDLHSAVQREQQRRGPNHEHVATARWWLGYGLFLAKHSDEAIEQLELARNAYTALGLNSAVDQSVHAPWLIMAYLEQGALDAADTLIEQTLRVQDEAKFSADNEHRNNLIMLRGRLRAARGEPALARADYAQACDYFARTHEADDPLLAKCRLDYAQLLGPTPKGRALAKAAAHSYRTLGQGLAQDRAKAEALFEQDDLPVNTTLAKPSQSRSDN